MPETGPAPAAPAPPPAVAPGLGVELARAAEEAGVRKAHAPARALLVLGALAGAFIALGSAFSLTCTAGAAGALPFGLVRLLAGATFCLGLVLVFTTGSELFTGNVMLVMALTRRRIGLRALLRSWGLVLLGNALGAGLTAGLLLLTEAHRQGGGAVGRALLASAAAKCALAPLAAFVLGVLCNGLVCVAVWCSYGARSLTDRVLAVLFPITAFVALSFEHSVANLFTLPWALGVHALDPALGEGLALEALTPARALLANLLPVLLGNVVGGTLLVAVPYALAFGPSAEPPPGPRR